MALLRLGYRVAWQALRAWSFVRRPTVNGTLVAVFDDAGRVLMIRHTYADRARWELPGGLVGDREEPGDAAARELDEEVGVAGVPLEPLGLFTGEWAFKDERLWVFRCAFPGGRRPYDPVEIAELRWVDPADPPHCYPGTRAVLARLSGTS